MLYESTRELGKCGVNWQVYRCVPKSEQSWIVAFVGFAEDAVAEAGFELKLLDDQNNPRRERIPMGPYIFEAKLETHNMLGTLVSARYL